MSEDIIGESDGEGETLRARCGSYAKILSLAFGTLEGGIGALLTFFRLDLGGLGLGVLTTISRDRSLLSSSPLVEGGGTLLPIVLKVYLVIDAKEFQDGKEVSLPPSERRPKAERSSSALTRAVSNVFDTLSAARSVVNSSQAFPAYYCAMIPSSPV